MTSYARRIDSNQNEIVRLFRKLGAKVQILSHVGRGCPDLLIMYNKKLHLVEVKDGSKPLSAQKLTDDEQKFISIWSDVVTIVRCQEDAILLLRSMRG